jgi:integrase
MSERTTRARESTGGAFESRGRFYMRVTTATKQRPAKLLPWCKSLDDAEARAQAVQALVNRLREAHEESWIKNVMKEGATANAEELEGLERTIARIVDGKIERVDDANAPVTLEAFAKQWTDGELHTLYPDHVAKKEKAGAADDARVFKKYINPHIGPRSIASITLDDADLVMRKLPAHLAVASRRQVAQSLRRLLALAVYPARHRTDNPIPTGWLPKVKRAKAFTFLYPEEDAALMQCAELPLRRRLFFGVLAREGMRREELGALLWGDVDLKRGMVKLDENKTDDPRAWALDQGVARALTKWKAQGKRTKPTDLVFNEDGEPLGMFANCAWHLREALKKAGLKRAELYDRTEVRQPIRVHDLRASFVTVSLANGKTETWVADRTGHRSSEMINRYRRAARTWAEAGLGSFAPLDEIVAWEEPPGRGSIRGSKRIERPSESATAASTSREYVSDNEGLPFEIRCTRKGTKGSNPLLSATIPRAWVALLPSRWPSSSHRARVRRGAR